MQATATEIKKFKVVFKAYFGTRRRPILAESHITSVSWDDKRGAAPYTVARLGWSFLDSSTGKPVTPPQLFSWVVASEIAKQLPKWNLTGPEGRVTGSIEPVEVSSV